MYNPVLLFKDFNAHGELKSDMSLMMNADVPVLAVNGIVNNPINPFSGKPITNESKKNGIYININHRSNPDQHDTNIFNIKDNEWVFVYDNIFDAENWILKKP
jgi:hypothetical protein